MSFTAYNFFLFAIVLFFLYYLVPRKEKTQWLILLIGSYVFYAFGGIQYMGYIVVTTVSSYLFSRRLGHLSEVQTAYLKEHKKELSKEEKKSYKAGIKKKRWALLVACLLLNFGILAFFKVNSELCIRDVNRLLGSFGVKKLIPYKSYVFPLGISFYTFMSMGYMIDVYREKYEPEKNPFKLALLVSFFPQLIQGPIGKFDETKKTMFAPHKFNSLTVCSGLQRVLWGYFKKLVVADRLLVATKNLFEINNHYTGAYVFIGLLFHAFQLYCDFTGGIDITIGISEALGITLTENFYRPFFSKSIKEYWRRWHVSLGIWFTEYVFYPVSVCKPMLKFSKFTRSHFGEHMGKRVPVYVSTIAVWLVTGVWHGLAWNFLMWGFANCFFLILGEEMEPLYRKFHGRFSVEGKRWFRDFRIIRTFLLMCCIRMFDCYLDVPYTFKMWWSMFATNNYKELFQGGLLQLGLTLLDYKILVVALAIIFAVSVIQRTGSVREKIRKLPFAFRFVLWYGLFLLTLLWGAYGIGYDASQFIYNQF